MSSSKNKSKRPSDDPSPGRANIKVRKDYISKDAGDSADIPSGSGLDMARARVVGTTTSALDQPASVDGHDVAPAVAKPRDPEIAQHFAMVNQLKHIITDQAANVVTSPEHGVHEMSDSGEASADERSMGDPLDQLISAADLAADKASGAHLDKVLDDWAGFFDGREEKGEDLSEKMAELLSASLRRRPNDVLVKEAASKFKFPANVPNMVVPALNDDLRKAYDAGGKVIEGGIFRCVGLVAKAMVPVVRMVDDVANQRIVKPATAYLDGANVSVRLMATVFNLLNHVRKDVARFHVKETALQDICNWECDVGSDKLFPFNVTKRCDEIRKTRRLGSSDNRNNHSFGRGGVRYFGSNDRYRYYDHKSGGGDRVAVCNVSCYNNLQI